MIKKILIGIVVVVLAVVAVALFFAHKVATQAAQPLDIPDVAGKPEVLTSLKQRVAKVAAKLSAPGAPAAAAEPESISVGGDELTLIVAKLLPDIPGMRLKVDVVNGQLDLKLSMPTKELTSRFGSILGPLKEMFDRGLVWINIVAKADMHFGDGKLTLTVKEVREPSWLKPASLQSILDEAMKGVPPGPIVVPLGDTAFKLVELDLQGSEAALKVTKP